MQEFWNTIFRTIILEKKKETRQIVINYTIDVDTHTDIDNGNCYNTYVASAIEMAAFPNVL